MIKRINSEKDPGNYIFELLLMKKIISLVLWLPIFAININCSNQDKTHFKGELVFSYAGYRLMKLDLSTLQEQVIFRNQQNTDFFLYISKISEHKIICSVDSWEGPPILELFNLLNNEVQVLREGISPAFISEHNALFFYVLDKPYGPYAKLSLYLGDLARLEDAKMVCLISATDSIRSDVRERPVVQLSADTIVFCGPGRVLSIYDFTTGKLSQTSFRNIYPLAWREKSEELICYDRNDKHFLMLDWRTKNTRPLDLGMWHTGGWTYIKEYDILLFTVETAEGGDLYYYDFGTSSIERLKPHLSLEGCVYFAADYTK